MASIELEGDTLGEKHRNFNALVKAAAADDTNKLKQVNYTADDIKNLLRIEVACIRRILNTIGTKMASIELEGDTLGEKHRNFNALVKAAAADDTYKLKQVNYTADDIQNLLRIEVACIRRKVEYILDVLKSEDMLYVSRAINRSIWLVTDDQFVNVINPEYLHEEMFPKMTAKAKNRLLSLIRRNLKDSSRVETFFNYYKDDMSIAQYWLRHCSVDFIQEVVAKHADEVSFNVMKHLCRKSAAILKCYLNSHSRDSSPLHRYLLNAKREEVTDILDSIYSANQRVPRFRKKFTRSLMKRYPDVVINNFVKYYDGIHIPTFVKYMQKEKIENFLLEHIQKHSIKQLVRYEHLKHFLRYMPEAQRLRLIETIISGKENGTMSTSNLTDIKGAIGLRYYEFVPFDITFSGLKKELSVASTQSKRNSILSILIHSARGNPQHVHSLLQYYRTQHIDDSFDDKVKFLNKLLSPRCIHKFNTSIWNILDDICISMGLYTDTNDNMSKCLETMIVYKLLKEHKIPETIEKKINFKSFLDFRNKLDDSDQRKVLNYIYDSCFTKLYKDEICEEEQMRTNVSLVISVLRLLKDWNKGPEDYSCVNDKIRNIIETKVVNSWNINLCHLYHANKLFRKNFKDESLLLCPNDETFVNALKHNPNMLLHNRNEIIATISLKRTIGILRIYWPKSTVQQWVDFYLDRLQKFAGHKVLVESLFLLLPRIDAKSILIQKYAPDFTESKNVFDYELTIGQNISRCLHLIRPLIDVDSLLMYAKKEYFPYILTSLDVILRNKSPCEFWVIILVLLDNEFLCRYAARKVSSLLKINTPDGYNSVKSSLIKKLHKILYSENNAAVALDIWNLYSKIFDDLPMKEKDRLTRYPYNMHKINKAVLTKYIMKIYSFRSSNHSKKFANDLFTNYETIEIIPYLEQDFLENVVVKVIMEKILTKSYSMYDPSQVFALYLLNCNSEKTQIERYESKLTPIMEHYFSCWQSYEVPHNSPHFEKHGLYEVLDYVAGTLYKSITEFKAILPVKLFTLIKDKLESALNFEEDFHLMLIWNLNVIFVEILSDYTKIDGHLISDEERRTWWDNVCLRLLDSFGQAFIQYLQPMLLECSSLHIHVSRVCMTFFSTFQLCSQFSLLFVKYLLSNITDPIIYLIAIDISRNIRLNDDEESLKNIHKELVEKIRSQTSIEVRCYYNYYADVLKK